MSKGFTLLMAIFMMASVARADVVGWPNGDEICRTRLHNTDKTGDKDAIHQCCNDVVLVENEAEDKKEVQQCEERLLAKPPAPKPEPKVKKHHPK